MQSFTWKASVSVSNDDIACNLLTHPETYKNWSRTFRCVGETCDALHVGDTFHQVSWCGDSWCPSLLSNFVYVSEECKVGWDRCQNGVCKDIPLFPQSRTRSLRIQVSQQALSTRRTNWIENGTFFIEESVRGWLAPIVYLTKYMSVDGWFKSFAEELQIQVVQSL